MAVADYFVPITILGVVVIWNEITTNYHKIKKLQDYSQASAQSINRLNFHYHSGKWHHSNIPKTTKGELIYPLDESQGWY